jgi:hypothetical protein
LGLSIRESLSAVVQRGPESNRPCALYHGAPLTPELLALEELLTFEVSVVLALSASPAAIPG